MRFNRFNLSGRSIDLRRAGLSEVGASAVETALLLALCAALSVATVSIVGQSVSSIFTSYASVQPSSGSFFPPFEEGGGSETGD